MYLFVNDNLREKLKKYQFLQVKKKCIELLDLIFVYLKLIEFNIFYNNGYLNL